MAEQNPQPQPQPAPEPKPGTNPQPQPPPPQPNPEDTVKAAVEVARKQWEVDQQKKAAKEKEDAERKAAEEQGKWKELADKERTDREKATAELSTMHRENQLLKVDRQLRDYLADETRREYLGNAPDIMLHVEKRLEPDAKPEAVTKLIADEVKAFMDRTPRGLRGNGAPPAPRAGKLPAGSALPPRKDGDEGKPQLTHIGRGF
jgi:hypothetical protein